MMRLIFKITVSYGFSVNTYLIFILNILIIFGMRTGSRFYYDAV